MTKNLSCNNSNLITNAGPSDIQYTHCHNYRKKARERITSIDALRAVVLLGILLVHTFSCFGFPGIENDTFFGKAIRWGIAFLLSSRCANIFMMLFGISFFLILRNPNYSSKKFVWRCFVLALLGVFNKIFYVSDALIWYGIWGMVLICFRHASAKKLFVLFFIIFTVNGVLVYFVGWNDILRSYYDYSITKYSASYHLKDVLSYPLWKSILNYVMGVSPFGALSLFLLGYSLAKGGIIENLQRYVTIKWLGLFSLAYIVLWIIGSHTGIQLITDYGFICGAFCYAELFLLLYYKFYPKLRFLEPYGKLGLTNYSMQGLLGVILSSVLFVPNHWAFEYVLLTMLLFYIIQVLFSIMWLRHFKYGPLEWLWRCITERKWMENRINRI